MVYLWQLGKVDKEVSDLQQTVYLVLGRVPSAEVLVRDARTWRVSILSVDARRLVRLPEYDDSVRSPLCV